MFIDYLSTHTIRTSLTNNPPTTGVMSSVTSGYGDTPVQSRLGEKPLLGNCKQGAVPEIGNLKADGHILSKFTAK